MGTGTETGQVKVATRTLSVVDLRVVSTLVHSPLCSSPHPSCCCFAPGRLPGCACTILSLFQNQGGAMGSPRSHTGPRKYGSELKGSRKDRNLSVQLSNDAES